MSTLEEMCKDKWELHLQLQKLIQEFENKHNVYIGRIETEVGYSLAISNGHCLIKNLVVEL